MSFEDKYKCAICKQYFDGYETYEYRGAFACEKHFDEMTKDRDRQRQEIIEEESAKTEVFRGLDMGDSKIGKHNRELLKRHREVARNESPRLRRYERGES